MLTQALLALYKPAMQMSQVYAMQIRQAHERHYFIGSFVGSMLCIKLMTALRAHVGHVAFLFSQVRMHFLWNMWPQGSEWTLSWHRSS